jgi:hypothetical protein
MAISKKKHNRDSAEFCRAFFPDRFSSFKFCCASNRDRAICKSSLWVRINDRGVERDRQRSIATSSSQGNDRGVAALRRELSPPLVRATQATVTFSADLLRQDCPIRLRRVSQRIARSRPFFALSTCWLVFRSAIRSGWRVNLSTCWLVFRLAIRSG